MIGSADGHSAAPALAASHAVTIPVLRAHAEPTGLSRTAATTLAWFRHHLAFLVIIGVFIASWALVPIFTPAPVGDDWVYSISVEDLVQHGELEILGLSVTTLVFQVLWGALFCVVFGDGFGSQRFSTVVIFLMSGIAFYWMLRTLGISYGRSALGAAVYLFNPLSFVLAFSFMTDPHYLATMVISLAFYARGLRSDQRSRTHILLGSFFAGCAFLVRQQGALIPFGIVVYLLLTRQLWFNWRSVVRIVEIVLIPTLMLIVYYLWIFFIHGVPDQQDQFLQQALSAGVGGAWKLLRQMTYFEGQMIGLFVLPITAAALASLWPIVRQLVSVRRGKIGVAETASRYLLMLVWLIITVVGCVAFFRNDWYMPYISQYIGTTGLGPNDLIGGRPSVLDDDTTKTLRQIMTWACMGSAVLFGAAVIGRLGGRSTPSRGLAAMLVVVGLGQVAGVMPPSFHFRTWIISVDRYLLPLLPFAIALLLWALRDRRLAMPVAWVLVGIMAAWSIVGTRDFLVFQKATWDYARYINYDMGIPLTRMDGGSSWDGYYLYEYGLNNHIPQQTVGGPWWTNLFASPTDSTYVISGSPSAPADGTYVLVDRREYSSWLNAKPVYLYLMQRVAEPAGRGPAAPIPDGVPPPPVYAHPVS